MNRPIELTAGGKPRASNDKLINHLRTKLDQFIRSEGRRPRVLMGGLKEQAQEQLLKMANCLVDFGFDVDISPGRLTARRAAQMAIENDAHLICLGNLTKNDTQVLETLQAELRKTGSESVRIIGMGDLSRNDRDDLRQAAFTEIFTWEPPSFKSVGRVLDQLQTTTADLKQSKAYIDGVLTQDRCMIAKTISLIESRAVHHRAIAQQVLDGIYPHSGKAVRIGLTGIPGAGKSTFIESLGMRLLEMGKRVAVLAIDPSSSISGGSLLADKLRMPELSADPRAFIRPSPSRGLLGGVAGKTRETMMICEAAGYDVILVETVGVGQSETTVASMVDFFMLLQIAGAGDQYQGIKKGIIEMVDAIAITKADGDNIQNARQSREVYTEALGLLKPKSDHWTPPVITCSAYDPNSIDEVWRIISQYIERLTDSGELAQKRSRQSVDWMMAMVDQGLIDRFCENPRVARKLEEVLSSIESGKISPEMAARQLLEANTFAAI